MGPCKLSMLLWHSDNSFGGLLANVSQVNCPGNSNAYPTYLVNDKKIRSNEQKPVVPRVYSMCIVSMSLRFFNSFSPQVPVTSTKTTGPQVLIMERLSSRQSRLHKVRNSIRLRDAIPWTMKPAGTNANFSTNTAIFTPRDHFGMSKLLVLATGKIWCPAWMSLPPGTYNNLVCYSSNCSNTLPPFYGLLWHPVLLDTLTTTPGEIVFILFSDRGLCRWFELKVQICKILVAGDFSVAVENPLGEASW